MKMQILLAAIAELQNKDNANNKTMRVIDALRAIIREERVVDYSSLQLEGIDYTDYPDFCDAYFAYGEYTDGTPLSEEELEELNKDDAKYERLHGGGL